MINKGWGFFVDMPINAGYEYFNAEKVYLDAKTTEEKIVALEGLIRKAPKHKGSENLLSELKTRLKKLKEKSERVRKMGGGKKGFKKEGFQVVLLGLANSGKSTLLARLTNAQSAGSPYPFSTLEPALGTMDYEGARAQVVDLPSAGHGNFDVGVINTADCVLLVVDRLEDVEKLSGVLTRAPSRRIIVVTKTDLLSPDEKRKLDARCRSKRLDYVLLSSINDEGVGLLKKRIFEMMGVIRVYTKEPGKPPAVLPVVLPVGSSVKDVGESIRNGFYRNVKESRVTGPSAKFANQKVGLSHVLRDRDVVEFHTR